LAGAATKIDSVIGEVARYPLVEGEQIGEFRLVGKASARTLSAQIPKGLRGFTVPVSVNNSPAGVLAPGDFVDIIVSGPLSLVQLPSESGVNDDDSDLRAAVTLLQNVQVLAVQREYVNNGVPYDSSVRGEAPEADRIGYVTLAVTPEQAQLLWLASQHTTITLTLRPFGDEEVVDLFPIAEPFRLE
jgi:pilus assembly protein CpaB